MRANLFGKHLPRHDIAVMLQLAQHDAVARLYVRCAPALRNQINALGGTTQKNDFIGRSCTHEAGYAIPRRLECHSHIRRPRIHTAMDRCVIHSASPHHRIEHDLRLLRRCSGVEIMPVVG